MSEVIRDFSVSAIEHMYNLVKEKVDDEDQFFLCDWFEDTFQMDDLDIKEYLNDIDNYQAHMADKHDIDTEKFQKLVERVHDVDAYYSRKFQLIYENINNLSSKILNLSSMIIPGAVTVECDIYGKALEKIDKTYSSVEYNIVYELEKLEEAKPIFRDIPWYESAMNAAGGFLFEGIRTVIEGEAYIPFTILEMVTGVDYNDNLKYSLDVIEEYIVDNWVTDKVAFYYGSATADLVATVFGAYQLVSGLSIAMSGITIETAGVALTGTGVGSIVGVPVIAVSVPVVVAGVVVTANSFGVIYVAQRNFDENIMLAQSSGGNGTQVKGKGNIPVKDKITASNGLNYQSNPKHTLGQLGNRPNAGIEPENSLELFEESILSTQKPNQRFTYDEETNTLHRFYDDGNGTWHWSGSTNQGANSLTGSQVPNDIKKHFNLSKKGW